jgi:ER membrane protein complex subunit 3
MLAFKSKKLRLTSGILAVDSFGSRKNFLSLPGKGALYKVEKKQDADPMAALGSNPMMNPEAMSGMLKNNLFMAIATPLQYGLISTFFSGFLVGKVPFPLTQKFRELLQAGVSVLSLDVQYISSISLYFLTLFGFNSLYRIVLSEADDDMQSQMAGMNPMMMGMGMQQPSMSGPTPNHQICEKEAGNYHVTSRLSQSCETQILVR